MQSFVSKDQITHCDPYTQWQISQIEHLLYALKQTIEDEFTIYRTLSIFWTISINQLPAQSYLILNVLMCCCLLV